MNIKKNIRKIFLTNLCYYLLTIGLILGIIFTTKEFILLVSVGGILISIILYFFYLKNTNNLKLRRASFLCFILSIIVSLILSFIYIDNNIKYANLPILLGCAVNLVNEKFNNKDMLYVVRESNYVKLIIFMAINFSIYITYLTNCDHSIFTSILFVANVFLMVNMLSNKEMDRFNESFNKLLAESKEFGDQKTKELLQLCLYYANNPKTNINPSYFNIFASYLYFELNNIESAEETLKGCKDLSRLYIFTVLNIEFSYLDNNKDVALEIIDKTLNGEYYKYLHTTFKSSILTIKDILINDDKEATLKFKEINRNILKEVFHVKK